MSEENKDTIGSLKIRVANMLLNTVSLSDSLNIIKDVCVKRGEEIIDNASEEELGNIKVQVQNYEDAVQKAQEQQAGGAGTQPANVVDATPVIDTGTSGPSGPDPSGQGNV